MTSSPLPADPLAAARLLAAVLEASAPSARRELPGSLLLEAAAGSSATCDDRGQEVPVVRFGVVDAAGERVAVAASDALLGLVRLGDRGAGEPLRVLLGAVRRADTDPTDPRDPTPASPRECLRRVVRRLADLADAPVVLEVRVPSSGWCTVTPRQLLAALDPAPDLPRRRARSEVAPVPEPDSDLDLLSDDLQEPPPEGEEPPPELDDAEPEPADAAVALDEDDDGGRRPAPDAPAPDAPAPDAPAPGEARSWDADRARWARYRVPLGRGDDGAVVWGEPFGSVLCVAGAPRSGKSTGLPIPALAAWPGPALVLSARTDVLDVTLAARARRGPVAVFNPSGLRTRVPSTRYDLLRSGASTWAEARRLAEHLASGPARSGLRDGDFWFSLAAQWLGPALFAAAVSGLTMADVVRWAATHDHFEVEALLRAAPDGDGALAAQSLEAVADLDERTRASVLATVSVCLAVFDLPTVCAAIGSGFDDSFLLARDGDDGDDADAVPTLYAVAPATEQAAVAPVMRLLVTRAVRAAVAQHLETGLPARLMVVIDEAGNVGSLDALAELTTTAAGCGVQLVTIFHGLSQVERLYGQLDAETVVDHASVLVFLRGGSRSSAALLEQLTPGAERGEGLRRLRGIPPGHGIFVREGHEPELLRLLAHWRDVDLAASL